VKEARKAMKDEAKNRLKQMLAVYDEKLAETSRREAAARAAKEAFPERFSVLKKETIVPVLKELAEVLNASGHEATVREQEESSSTVGSVTSAAVGLSVVPKPFVRKGTDTKKSFTEIMFSANRSDQKIVVSSTNTIIKSSGGVGKRGEYELGALTGDVVVEHVLKNLEEAFNGE
jgi:hypothetical protein